MGTRTFECGNWLEDQIGTFSCLSFAASDECRFDCTVVSDSKIRETFSRLWEFKLQRGTRAHFDAVFITKMQIASLSSYTSLFSSPLPRLQISSHSLPPLSVPSAKPKLHRACVRCRQLKMSCDQGRPCSRCIKSKKGDCCQDPVDVYNRKRKAEHEPDTSLVISRKLALSPMTPVSPHADSPNSLLYHDIFLGTSEAENLQQQISNLNESPKDLYASPLPDITYHKPQRYIGWNFISNLCEILCEDSKEGLINRYGKAFDSLLEMKQMAEQQQLIPMGVYQYNCQQLLSKGKLGGIPDDLLQQVADVLNPSPVVASVEARKKACEEFHRLTASADPHTGVIGFLYDEHGATQDVFVNVEAGRLLGYPDMDIKAEFCDPLRCFWGRTWQDEDCARIQASDFEAMATNQDMEMQVKMTRESGDKILVTLRATNMLDDNGIPLAKIWSFTPVETSPVQISELDYEL